ncbi:MAG: PLD-like domain [Thermoleophilia bacterium]|nr:PLD-like domain [Thermoleophilia bacterium]
MPITIVGTRAHDLVDIASIVERITPHAGDSLAVASAYWDATACNAVLEIAARIGGPARLLLWTAGSTKKGWRAAREAVAGTAGQTLAPGLDLRFIDAPAGGGIFHAKLAGVVGADGEWRSALVGSANLTSAGRSRNVELGIAIHDEPRALEELRTWFDRQFDAALPASEIDWDAAIATAADTSEAAERLAAFTELGLARPSPAPDPR